MTETHWPGRTRSGHIRGPGWNSTKGTVGTSPSRASIRATFSGNASQASTASSAKYQIGATTIVNAVRTGARSRRKLASSQTSARATERVGGGGGVEAPVPVAFDADLGGDHQVLRVRVQGLSDQLVGHVWAVGVAGVEVVDAEFHRASQHRERALAQGQIAINSILRDWVKGQIMAIETGILSFDAVFLPFMLTHDGRTVSDRVNQLVQAVPAGFAILSGDDPLTVPFLALGAVGLVSVAANLIPDVMARLVRACRNGSYDEALEIQKKYYPLMRALMTIDTNPVPIKSALALRGLCSDELRLPLVALTAEKRDLLRATLARYDLL